VWEYAIREGIAVLTKDKDFALRRLCEPQDPTIIWLSVGNCSRAWLYDG
jgi:predicted nuclease of predicted toxin-antitoxin system